MREKVIEFLDEAINKIKSMEEKCDACANAKNSCIAKLQAENAHLKEVQKWIPVTERLPDKDGKYLTYYHNHFVDITRVLDFAKDARKVNKYDFLRSWKKVWYEYDSEYGYFTIDDVTHWMPLPEAPKGE